MPFDLFISRASKFSHLDGSGWFGKKPSPITEAEFKEIMEEPYAIRPDGDVWMTHAEDNSPWFAARLTPQGYIVLSTSYTNHNFLNNCPALIDASFQIAESLGANLFEETRGLKIDKSNIEQILAHDSDYVTLQVQTFNHAVDQMDQGPGGPFEYPIGPLDLASEYFAFHIDVPQDSEDLSRLIEGAPQITGFHSAGPQHGMLLTDEDVPLTKLLLRPDSTLQIWPSHGRTDFATAATATFNAVVALARYCKGKTTFNGRNVDSALAKEIHARSGGLGVECYEWVASWQE